MDAVSVCTWFITLKLEPYKFPLGIGFSADERIPADKVILFRLQGDSEPDSGLEGIGLVREFVTGKYQPGLDTNHVKGI